MTSVELIGKLRHNNEDLLLEVTRNYKNREGRFEIDYLPCIHWSKNNKHPFCQLHDGTRLFIKGRLESEYRMMYLVVEEYLVL